MTRASAATYDRRTSIEVNSNALILTAAAIERLVAEKLQITRGSCEISRTGAKRRTTTTLFRVRDAKGKTVLGRIELRIVADEKSIRSSPGSGWSAGLWHRRWLPIEGRDLRRDDVP